MLGLQSDFVVFCLGSLLQEASLSPPKPRRGAHGLFEAGGEAAASSQPSAGAGIGARHGWVPSERGKGWDCKFAALVGKIPPKQEQGRTVAVFRGCHPHPVALG